MIFDTIIEFGKKKNRFCTFKPGDQNRYPHLNLKLMYENAFDNYVSVDVEHNAREFLSKDITIRELIVPSARRIFIKDMLQMKYSDYEKLTALYDVSKFEIPSFTIEQVTPNGFGWNKQIPLNIVKIESKNIFPIGVMAKGTDIAIIDQNDATFGQEVAHSIYHYKEGISKGGENITEVHGDPFFVYALQCRDGRLSRRIREGQSPHRIKFSDYICLRAFAGTKIKKGVYHGALGLLSPPMNLASTLVNESVLLEALMEGSSKTLENAINQYLGPNAYDEIYLDYNFFNRYAKIKNRGGKDAVERMFYNPLFDSELGQDYIKMVWDDPSLRTDNLIDLLEHYR